MKDNVDASDGNVVDDEEVFIDEEIGVGVEEEDGCHELQKEEEEEGNGEFVEDIVIKEEAQEEEQAKEKEDEVTTKMPTNMTNKKPPIIEKAGEEEEEEEKAAVKLFEQINETVAAARAEEDVPPPRSPPSGTRSSASAAETFERNMREKNQIVEISTTTNATSSNAGSRAPVLTETTSSQAQASSSRPGAYHGTPGANGGLVRMDTPRFSRFGAIAAAAAAGENNGDTMTEAVPPPPPSPPRFVQSGGIIGATSNQFSIKSSDAMISLAEAFSVHDHVSVLDLNAAEPVDINESKKRKAKHQNKQLFALGVLTLLFVCAIAGFIIGFVWSKKNKTADAVAAAEQPSITAPSSFPPSMAPSSAPTGSLDSLLHNLPTATLESLEDISTPQWKAMDWLSRHPRLQEEDMPEWRKIQLFALGTFFYSFQGPHWPEKIRNDWMDFDKSECFWFSNEYGAFVSSSNKDNEEEEDDTLFFQYYTTEQHQRLYETCDDSGNFQALVLFGVTPPHNPSSASASASASAGSTTTRGKAFIPPEISLLTNLKYIDLREEDGNTSGPALDFLLGKEMKNLERIKLQFGSSLYGTIPGEGLMYLTNLVVLDLSNNALTGPLPTQLGLLTNLSQLLMLRNQFTGTLPTQLGAVPNLDILGLSDNLLHGSVPSQVGAMTNLRRLGIENNQLGNALPTDLGRMTKLERLLTWGNRLSGIIPTELGLMSNINYLRISENHLSGPVPTEVGWLSNLTDFYVDNNALSSFLPPQLFKLTKLDGIGLHNNRLTGRLPSELGLLPRLFRINAENNFFTGSIASQVGMMSSLVGLNLRNNSLSGRLPSELGNLDVLLGLTVDGNNLSGPVPTELGRLQSLNALALQSNSFSGRIPSEVGTLPFLQGLVLGGNWFSGVVPSELGQLKYFGVLDLSNLPLLTGSIPSEVLSLKLGFLDVRGSGNLSATIPEVLCHLEDPSCSFPPQFWWLEFTDISSCAIGFDCSDFVCGCDCPCAANATHNASNVGQTFADQDGLSQEYEWWH